MKVVVTQQIPELALKKLKKEGYKTEVLSSSGPLPAEKLSQKVVGADAIISVLTDKIDGRILDSAGKQLKIVANYAVGYDNIDLAAAQDRGVAVSNTPGVLTEAVAEHTLALMMAVAKRVVEADGFVRSGGYKHWLPMGFIGKQLWGKTLGIIGLGRIGSFLAEICYYGFKMKIFYNDIKRDERFEMELGAKYHELETLLKGSDFISLNVPLLDSTRHLIGAREFKLMKRSAILINTARGAVVEERALIEALRDKTIAGAGLDVFENEPEIPLSLRRLKNVVLTPHIASATLEAREAMAKIAADNVIAALSGRQIPNLVKS